MGRKKLLHGHLKTFRTLPYSADQLKVPSSLMRDFSGLDFSGMVGKFLAYKSSGIFCNRGFYCVFGLFLKLKDQSFESLGP